MRIAFLYDAVHPYEKGGAQKRVWELARRLAADYDVHCYGMHYWDGPAVMERDGITYHGVCPPYDLYVGERRAIPPAIKFAAKLTPDLLREDFDVAGWVPGSSRAKVYVHLNNDDVNQAIREQYGIDGADSQEQTVDCPFCGATNQASHAECRTCGRPLSLRQQVKQEEKLGVLERLKELEEQGVLEKLERL